MTQANAPEMTREFVAENHPAIAEAFRAEGREEGASAERARIQAVEAHLMPGHEALVQSLKFDGKTSGPEAASQILQAERERRGKALTDLKADAAPARVDAAAAPKDDAPPAAAPATGAHGIGVNAAKADLHAKALDFQKSNPGTTYLQAVKAVQEI